MRNLDSKLQFDKYSKGTEKKKRYNEKNDMFFFATAKPLRW